MPSFFVVGAGAACGAIARYLLAAALGALGLGSVLPLLIINVLGSALMGYFKPTPFWGTGVLGGFTSFATFAYLTSGMTGAMAAGYVLATLVGCVGAYLLGSVSAERRRAA
ncbi:fluoride efflux transporter family protein [Corynebacterium sp.]|uniref:fluoride efflux transporter family protein n=1 Tax=Corynebacterium sp. TaxID=1720 RepID=UPI0026DD0D2E|nr:fluoride efflux transporter family protein [Corynebacterium sp.]MDO5033006.1 fluoride efflux transporter family protein [Corynebacterium sp.]